MAEAREVRLVKWSTVQIRFLREPKRPMLLRRVAEKWPASPIRFEGYLFVLYYWVLSNIPFWFAARYLRIERDGWFCLEYLCVGVLALFVPGIIAAFLMFGSIAADMLFAISRSYYLSPFDCLRSIASLRELPGQRLGTVIATVLLAILIATLAAILPKQKISGAHRLYMAGCLIGLGVILRFADYTRVYLQTGMLPTPSVHRQSLDAKSAYLMSFDKIRLCRSPSTPITGLIGLTQEEIKFSELDRQVHAAVDRSARPPSAVGVAGFSTTQIQKTSNAINEDKTPNLVIVLVESWGLPLNPGFRDLIVRPYLEPGLGDHYRVLQGTVPFYGSTIAGEARELCDSYMGYHLLDASVQELQGCLPDRLAAIGYHTVGIHGMDSRFFRRLAWYDTIGFQETWFEDRFQQLGLPECAGAFNGICDADIAQWIGHRLQQPNKQPSLLYWVTLNSHLPVPIPSGIKGAAPCATIPSEQQTPPLCSWFQLVSNVHLSVAHIAESNLSRPTVFVIVGDHAPPFADPFLRNQFSASVVPYVIVAPR